MLIVTKRKPRGKCPYKQQIEDHHLYSCLTSYIRIRGLLSKENEVLSLWGSETREFGIIRVDKGQITVTKVYKVDVLSIRSLSEQIEEF